MVLDEQQPKMLLLIPCRHKTLSILLFCLIRSQRAISYLISMRLDLHWHCPFVYDPPVI